MKKVDIHYFAAQTYLHGLKSMGSKVALKKTTVNLKTNGYNTSLCSLEDGGKLKVLVKDCPRDFFFLNGDTIAYEKKLGKADIQAAKKHWPLSVYHALSLQNGESQELFRVNKNVIKCQPFGKDGYVLLVEESLRDDELLAQANGDMEAFSRFKAQEENFIVGDELPFRADGRLYMNRLRQSLYTLEKGKLQKLTGQFEYVHDFSVGEGVVVFHAVTYEDVMPTTSSPYVLDLTTQTVTPIPQNAPYVITQSTAMDGKTAILVRQDKKIRGEYQDEYLDLVNIVTGETLSRLNGDDNLHVYNSVLTDLTFGDSGPKFLAHKGGLVFVATLVDSCHIMFADFASGTIQQLTPPHGKIIDFTVAGDTVYFSALIEDQPQELYAVDMDGQNLRCITQLNRKLAKDYRVVTPEPITSVSSDGMEVYGFYLKPADFEAGKKYPTILYIHGGPNCAYGKNLMHEMQLMAAEGYGIMYCNSRGSIGRGSAFADIREKYYKPDYDDLMCFVRHCTQTLDWIDTERLGVTGGSYGGMMTNHIITHTHQFKAAVSDRGICNEISNACLSDLAFSMAQDCFGDTIWGKPEQFWEQSALKHAPNCNTPTLFIHGNDDFRCEVDQGFQMFAALKYLGVPTRVVAFKGGAHGFSRNGKPLSRIRRLEEIRAWFKKYL